MSRKRSDRRCAMCGGPLSIERGEYCIGCSLIAFYGGDDPRVKQAQEEFWRRVMEEGRRSDHPSLV